jgi:DNA-binding MarR family transcriptional regulator
LRNANHSGVEPLSYFYYPVLVAAPDSAVSGPAVAAWKSVLALVGWGGRRPPRFPAVATKLGLAPKQLGVLWRLEPGAEMPMGALAESLYCDASYVTDLVDRLEQRGLIERRSSSQDRRVKLIALTPLGEMTREQALELLYDPPEELANLEPAEQEELARLLRKALGESTPAPGRP